MGNQVVAITEAQPVDVETIWGHAAANLERQALLRDMCDADKCGKSANDLDFFDASLNRLVVTLGEMVEGLPFPSLTECFERLGALEY